MVGEIWMNRDSYLMDSKLGINLYHPDHQHDVSSIEQGPNSANGISLYASDQPARGYIRLDWRFWQSNRCLVWQFSNPWRILLSLVSRLSGWLEDIRKLRYTKKLEISSSLVGGESCNHPIVLVVWRIPGPECRCDQSVYLQTAISWIPNLSAQRSIPSSQPEASYQSSLYSEYWEDVTATQFQSFSVQVRWGWHSHPTPPSINSSLAKHMYSAKLEFSTCQNKATIPLTVPTFRLFSSIISTLMGPIKLLYQVVRWGDLDQMSVIGLTEVDSAVLFVNPQNRFLHVLVVLVLCCCVVWSSEISTKWQLMISRYFLISLKEYILTCVVVATSRNRSRFPIFYGIVQQSKEPYSIVFSTYYPDSYMAQEASTSYII